MKPILAKRSALVGTIALFVGLAILYLLQLTGWRHPLVTNSLFLIAPGLAVLAGFHIARIYRLSSLEGSVMAFLTAGLACWFIGECLFFAFQFIFHINPFPSAADVFYIGAYFLIFIGLVREITAQRVNWRNFNPFALAMIILLTGALAFIVGYFGIFLAYNAASPLLDNIVAMAYGVGDLMVLIPTLFVLKMALDFRGGKLFAFWMFVLVALLCIMVGDILFAIFTDQYKALQPGYNLIDLAWIAGYLLFAYGFFYTAETIKEIRATIGKTKE